MPSSFYRVGLTVAAIAASSVCVSRPAFSADLCKALILRDVGAIEDPGSIEKKGAIHEAITQYNYDKKTSEFNFCSHGGYCYPAHVLVNGKLLETFKLLNCKIGSKGYEDKEEISYELEVDRSKNSAATLRVDDIENRFLDLGLCSACASNVALFYVKRLDTPCGRLAKQALEGNPEALNKLQDSFNSCAFSYKP